MIIKLKEFKEVADKILLAAGLDENAANVELRAKDHTLYLAITNREYYCCVKFPIESDEEFRAVVDASLFLSLIAGLTTETFELEIKDNNVLIKSGKSNYKLAMIYENDQLMNIPVISIRNKTVEMPISNDILMSILNVNSKELLKTKWLVDVSELQKLYYIDETGCFTFTVGACMNSFSLEKPVKILLNDRIVKLFKLFKTDVQFSLGHDEIMEGVEETKVTFETDDIYVAAKINCEDALLNKVRGPYEATKRFLSEKYNFAAVVSVPALSAAINRLMLFAKNSVDKANMGFVPVKAIITPDSITLMDKFENSEDIVVENGSNISESYEFGINLTDVKLILDSCKAEHITLNYGNHKFVNFVRGNISNLIPEVKKNA